MQTSDFSKSGVMAVIHSLIAEDSWKFYLRAKGMPIAFDGNNAFWTSMGVMVFEPLNQAMVFIGFSGTKQGLDVQIRGNMNWRSFIQKFYQYTSGGEG